MPLTSRQEAWVWSQPQESCRWCHCCLCPSSALCHSMWWRKRRASAWRRESERSSRWYRRQKSSLNICILIFCEYSTSNSVWLTPTYSSSTKKLSSFWVPEEKKKPFPAMFHLWLLVEIELLHFLIFLLILQLQLFILHDIIFLDTLHRHGFSNVWCEYDRCTEQYWSSCQRFPSPDGVTNTVQLYT